MKLVLSPVCAVALVALAPAFPRVIDTAQVHGPLQVSDATVAVRCPLTVGGSFDAKTSAMSGELVLGPDKGGSVDGEIAVDLRTLQTGIGLRDNHMRDGYLEVQKGDGYETAVLDRIRLEGIDPAQPAGKATFHGVLSLHGQERDVTGTAEIRRAGSNFRVQASFPVKVSDFAIAAPSYLGVGVRNEVSVAVSFQAASKHSF